MNLLSVLLFGGGTTSGGQGTGGGWMNFVVFGLVIVVFYFFFIRPQSKRNKEQKLFRESLKKGDKVVTAGGIHGKILEVNETTVIIETEGQGRLKIEKMSIASSIKEDSSNS